jgi:hypothetical protein
MGSESRGRGRIRPVWILSRARKQAVLGNCLNRLLNARSSVCLTVGARAGSLRILQKRPSLLGARLGHSHFERQ